MSDFSKIYKYVTDTPENINPNVLKSLIETEYNSVTPTPPAQTNTVEVLFNREPLAEPYEITGYVGEYINDIIINVDVLSESSVQALLNGATVYSEDSLPINYIIDESLDSVNLAFIMPPSTVFNAINIVRGSK